MLNITSDIEGKTAYYGEIRQPFAEKDFHLNGNWEYHQAYFDKILDQNEGDTIYLRIPVQAEKGKLDQDDAFLRFGSPFVLNHVVNTGLSADSSPLDSMGMNQFQDPIDPDGRIDNETKWRQAAEKAINQILIHVQ